MGTVDLVDALFDILEPGDLLKFEATGLVRKVVDLLPSHLMWEDEDGEVSLISWTDFVSMNEWDEENRPRLVKYYDTEEYKKRSAEVDAMFDEVEEEYRRDPQTFIERYGESP